MPELPEVETVVRQLAPLLTGRGALALDVRDPKLAGAARPDLRGRRIQRVFRVGKFAVVAFEGEALCVHLRMTGRLIWRPAGTVCADPYVRATLRLDTGRVDFSDPRRFGTMTWASAPDAGPGVDPTSDDFSLQRLRDLLRGARQPLKTWLLRQDRITGLGNIYASEILHEARLSPLRAAGSLTRAESARLHAATRGVLAAAIANCGTTFSDFQDAHGVTGGYARFLQVYDREGQPCHRCGSPVRRAVQQQRSTYWCPACVRRKK